MEERAWRRLADLMGQAPRACMWVLMVSTGNMATCSTVPAMEPATMNCQKWRPSWDGDAIIAGWKSGGFGIGKRSGFWKLGVASEAIRSGFEIWELGLQ